VPKSVKITNKSKTLAIANIKEEKGNRYEKLEEELATPIRQLNVRNASATDEVINVNTVRTAHCYCTKYSSNVFSFCN